MLRTSEKVGVMWPFRPYVVPQECKGEVATCDFVPFCPPPPPREGKGYVAIPPIFGPPQSFNLVEY